jgi:hypothetical protein
MTAFLTVSEAAKRTGKSQSSIRRILHPITHDDSHSERAHVQPSLDEVQDLRSKGVNFPWRLSEELLQKYAPLVEGAEKGSGRSSASGNDALIEMLRRELDIKNQQIAQYQENMNKQTAVMETLSERLHEGNVLIGSLQKQLQLTDGRDTITAESVRPTPAESKKGNAANSEKGSRSSKKTPKQKRGFFSGLFGHKS